jgi:hypothetical protein
VGRGKPGKQSALPGERRAACRSRGRGDGYKWSGAAWLRRAAAPAWRTGDQSRASLMGWKSSYWARKFRWPKIPLVGNGTGKLLHGGISA